MADQRTFKCGCCLAPIPAEPQLFVNGYPAGLCKACWLKLLPKP